MHSSDKKNLEIEFLRAFAVLIVMLAHAMWYMPFLHEWFSVIRSPMGLGEGVDLFFCISGYVVARSYCDWFDTHRASGRYWQATKSFWLKRCYRLLPSAWLWMLLLFFASITFNGTGIFQSPEQNLKSMFAIATFTANIAHLYDNLAPNNVYWSLALEEQFYFLFPLFLFLVRRWWWRVLLMMLLVVIQFPLARNAFGSVGEQVLAMFRIDGFAWGIIIFLVSRSVLYVRIEPVLLRSRLLAIPVSLMLLYGLTDVWSWVQPNYYYAVVAVVAGLLVFLASYGKGYLCLPRYMWRPLTWLGARSYAVYLIHMPVIYFMAEIFWRWVDAFSDVNLLILQIVSVLVFFGATFMLADLNYRLVETPLRRRGRRLADKIMEVR